MLSESVRLINDAAKTGKGMDVIIVSTDTLYQEELCQRHLEGLLGDLIKPTAKVVAVHEDWPGGAGNGLGTLYAYQKAQKKLKERYGIDLKEVQLKGASVAIYHTAGQGKRLSPLTGSEHNNKSSVKLPSFVGKHKSFMTLLDGVLKQTAFLAQNRKGRLSVFWGDQIFISSTPMHTPPNHHVEMFVQSAKWPDQQEWERSRWSQYGVVFFNENNDALLFEKPTFPFLEKLKKGKKLYKNTSKSLGCFSLSTPLTFALLDLFQEELAQKKGKYDTDPTFWMATTLPLETYLESLPNSSSELHQRMQTFAKAFCNAFSESPFLGATDIGAHSVWSDYGTVDQYFYNLLKLTETTPEGDAMRTFFGLKLDLANQSILLNSNISSSRFHRSIVMGTTCDRFEGNACVMINSQIRSGTGQKTLLYNVHEKELLDLKEGFLRADAFIEDRHVKLSTVLGRDGKKDWSQRLPGNALSYEEVYQLNTGS